MQMAPAVEDAMPLDPTPASPSDGDNARAALPGLGPRAPSTLTRNVVPAGVQQTVPPTNAGVPAASVQQASQAAYRLPATR
jgi:hypothetical protein